MAFARLLDDDAVTALAEHAVRHAAAMFAETVGGHISLRGGAARLAEPWELVEQIGNDCAVRPAVSVRQGFAGDLAGDAQLVLCERESLRLIRSLLADAAPLDELTELEQDALIELGNVVLNACLSDVAAQLRLRLTGTLPQYRRGIAGELLCGSVEGAALALGLMLDLSLAGETACGHLSITLQPPADRFLDRIDSHRQTA